MIDLHCHYLPGIDDGAVSEYDSLCLAQSAVADNVSAVVLTPHLHAGRYLNTLSVIRPEVRRFKQMLTANQISLRVFYAAEVRLSPEIIDWYATGELPFVGQLDGYRVLLLEFSHSVIPVGADKLVAWLLKQKIRPLIAHPERIKQVTSDPDKLLPFMSMGCMLQLTAGSFLGDFGKPVQQCCQELLDRDWVSVVASDAHNVQHRPSRMSAAANFFAKNDEKERFDNFSQVLPKKILGCIDA